MIFSEVYPLNSMIETPMFSFKVIRENDRVDLSGKTYFIRFNDFDNTVKKYQNIEVSVLKKGASILELSFEGHNKKKLEAFLNTTIDVLSKITSITGKQPIFENIDLKNQLEIQNFFRLNKNIDGIILQK